MGDYAASNQMSQPKSTQSPEIVQLVDDQQRIIVDLMNNLDALHARLGNVLHYEAPREKDLSTKREGMKTPLGDRLRNHNDDLGLQNMRIEYILNNLEL